MRRALRRQEGMRDKLCLLLDAVGGEWPRWIEAVIIAAERVAHQREIEPPALLRLPDMDELVDEEALQTQRRFAEIVAVVRARRVEMQMPHRRHHGAARLEREEAAAPDAHWGKIQRAAENAMRERLFARR